MVGVAGTSGGHPGLPLLKQGHHVQAAFEDLQGGRLHSFSRQPVSVLGHPHSEMFPDVQGEPPVFHFVSTASCLVIGHH